MKNVGIQYLAAIERLHASGWKPIRTIHICFAPDEEVGGNFGIKLLLGHKLMQDMRPGLVLDEGLAAGPCMMKTRRPNF